MSKTQSLFSEGPPASGGNRCEKQLQLSGASVVRGYVQETRGQNCWLSQVLHLKDLLILTSNVESGLNKALGEPSPALPSRASDCSCNTVLRNTDNHWFHLIQLGLKAAPHGEERAGCGVYQLGILGLKPTCCVFKSGKLEHLSDSTSSVKWD